VCVQFEEFPIERFSISKFFSSIVAESSRAIATQKSQQLKLFVNNLKAV